MKQKNRIFKWLCVAGGIALMLFFTHDIIVTHILAYMLCLSDPHPKTFVKKTIDYPESIYWEDNIYPGFDENDRLLMIRNYLDGVHLKTMALNGSDGTIYVYTATDDDWRESREIHARIRPGNYFKSLEHEARNIAERAKLYRRENIPLFNFSVTYTPIRLTPFERRYLWSDEITIKDNRTKEVIAYNRRLMRRWYMILPDFELGNRYYSPEPMCGHNGLMYFDEMVFTKCTRNFLPGKHRQFLNNKLYY